jgi:rhamnulokinase
MGESYRYLAFDLGAESGRAILGTLEEGRLALEEIHRFQNEPVRLGGTLTWDFPGLFREIKAGLGACTAKVGTRLDGIGADSWGVDFGLLDGKGRLLANPVHYRDERTEGVMQPLFRTVPKRTVFRRTGCEFRRINTLFQLYAMVRDENPLLESAERLLCIADLVHYFLTGEAAQEFTLATTTQMYDLQESEWAAEILEPLGIPTGMLPDVVAPGSIVGELREDVMAECGAEQFAVIAGACHDTAAAVAAVPATGEDWAYLSSGTWSLLGVEVPAPVIEETALDAGLTNEGGVDGTFRLLRNLCGLWLLQECRRTWAQEERSYDYETLAALAREAEPFRAVLAPQDPRFVAAGGMPERIRAFCRETGQTEPDSPGQTARIILESLALAYRETIERIEEVTGREIRTLHVVGGGSQHRLLNQLTADATGRAVRAGPVEATAIGNCLLQAIALGNIGSLAEARAIVARSFPQETFEPAGDRAAWDEAYAAYRRVAD